MNRPRTMLLAVILAGTGWWGRQPEQAIPGQDLLLQIHVETHAVEFGQAFELSVVRVWSRDLAPERWDDRALEPLVLRPIATSRRQNALRIEETRRFRAYLFRHGDVVIPAVVFRAKPRNGGLLREVHSEALELSVKAGLDPADTRNIEVLELLSQPASPWFAWSAAGLVLLAGLSLLIYNFAHRGSATPRATDRPSVNAHQRAAERLLALRTQQPVGGSENRAFYVEASDLLRSYIEDQFALRAKRMTTDEFLEAQQTVRALQAEERAILSGFLELCDLAKFAGQQPGTTEREQLLDAADTFLHSTQPTQEEGNLA